MIDRNFAPYDSPEFIDSEFWRTQTIKGELKTLPCVAAWSDICGFGSALRQARWNLQLVNETGLFYALSQTFELLGQPLIVGVPPMPTERILIINDGVARTTDLSDPSYINNNQLLFYVRNILIRHFLLERQLVQYDLGLRTVLAGGERCQYSPQKTTGQSVLYYTNEPSDFGKSILNQQFVYNPSEFQMNTAFALAFTLESFGSAKGLVPNRVYIDESWLKRINTVLPEPTVIEGENIHFMWNGEPGISITFDDLLQIEDKGFDFNTYRVKKFVIHERFEGEKTEFPMSEHDRKKVK